MRIVIIVLCVTLWVSAFVYGIWTAYDHGKKKGKENKPWS